MLMILPKYVVTREGTPDVFKLTLPMVKISHDSPKGNVRSVIVGFPFGVAAQIRFSQHSGNDFSINLLFARLVVEQCWRI
ncbi:hypothetical protein HMPREF0297_1495 [Corynebacterium jeikeium ATCC 43734]|nr:hypothetical protein HMPREF0297_1495 [Corynebacterium jeikeium ATCC 43734]